MSSSTIRKFFEQEEINSDKLESVTEDLNSDRASTKGQQTVEKKSKKIQNGEFDENNNNEEEIFTESKQNLDLLSDNNSISKKEISEKTEFNENEIKNNNTIKEENENEERKSEINKFESYQETLNNLNEEIENEHKNYSENIKQLQINLFNKSEQLKKISLKNSSLRNSLNDLNSQVDTMIISSSNKKYKVKKHKNSKSSPQILLKIKENELKNSKALLKIFQKDNIRIKSLLNNQNEVSINDLINKIKEKDFENQKLKTEINSLKVLNNSNSRNERSILQKKIMNLKTEINRNEQSYNRIKLNFERIERINSNSQNAYTTFRENVKKKIKDDKSHSKIKNIKKILLIPKSNYFNGLNIIDSIKNLKSEIKTLSKDEIEIMERFFEYDKERIEEFLKKISAMEKYQLTHDILIKKKSKEKDESVNNKNLKLKYLTDDNNYKDNKITFLKSQLNDYKNSKILLERKLLNIQNSIKKINRTIYQIKKF